MFYKKTTKLAIPQQCFFPQLNIMPSSMMNNIKTLIVESKDPWTFVWNDSYLKHLPMLETVEVTYREQLEAYPVPNYPPHDYMMDKFLLKNATTRVTRCLQDKTELLPAHGPRVIAVYQYLFFNYSESLVWEPWQLGSNARFVRLDSRPRHAY